MSKQDDDFEGRTIRRLRKKHDCHVTKIPAVPPISTTNAAGESVQFALEGTYDLLILKRVECEHHFRAYAIECKSRKEKRFPLACVTVGQMKGLVDFPSTAGVLFECSTVRRAFFITKAELLKKRTAKSIPLRELEEVAVELPLDTTSREKLAYYDMTPLLSGALPKSAQGGLFPEASK